MTWQEKYREALLEARRRYGSIDDGVPAAMLRQLLREYAAMVVRLESEIAKGPLAERNRELAANMRAEMVRYSQRLTRAFEGAQTETISRVMAAHRRGVNEASQAAGFEVTSSFAIPPRRVVEAMMVRRGLGVAESFQTLINRHLRELAPEVDRFITSAIGRGVASDRASKELATMMARDKEVKKFLRGKLVDTDIDTLRKAQSLLSDSRRIVQSEIQNTFFEADRQAAEVSPLVDLVRWRLSGRHAGLPSSPDICDYYATADLHGYGAGLYHPKSVPAPPHPNDQCGLDKVLRQPEFWDTPKRPIPEPRSVSVGEFRREMTRIAKGTKREHLMTPDRKYIDGQYKMLSGLSRANEVARRL